MRQPSIIILLISFILFSSSLSASAIVKGKIDYSMPIDYSKLSETELELKAREYYFLALKLQDEVVNDDMTNALMLYSILQNINPKNISYCTKLGSLYDKLNMDKYAKGNFSKAIGIDSSNPEPYFYFGEFYLKRQMLRKALKYYSEAYKLGYNTKYDMLYNMGDIYEKLGDSRSALKYLKEASEQSPNPELDNKIKRVESQNSTNNVYNSNTRIRI